MLKQITVKKVLFDAFIILLLAQDSIFHWLNLKAVSYADEFVIAIIVVAAILNIIRTKSLSRYSITFIVSLTFFSTIGIVSCLMHSQSTVADLFFSNFLAIKFWLLIVAFMNLKFSKEAQDFFIERIFFAEKIVILFAIFNFLFPDAYYQLFPDSDISRRFGFLSVCSIFDHPGKYGWFMLFCGIIHCLKAIQGKDKKELSKTWIAIVFSVFSFRTKVIVSIIGCATYYLLFLQKKEIKKVLKNILIILTILCSLLFIFGDGLKNTYSLYFTADHGVSARQALSQNGIRIAKDYFPTGVGFGKYATWYSAKNYSEYYYQFNMNKIYGLSPDFSSYITDVFWPAILGETGIFGFGIYLYMLWRLLKILVEIFNRGRKNSTFVAIAIIALIQTIFESFGEPSFNSSPQNLILGIIIGLVFSVNISTERSLSK